MSLLLYRIFLLLYQFGARLIAPWNAKARRWLEGRKDIFARMEQALASDRARPLIWFHCASLGEFEQARPLLEQIRRDWPRYRILLTFFSPSGYEVRKDYEGVDAVFYLPMDSPANARRLLAIARPQLICWVKYEYWFYYLHEIKRGNIPLLLISGVFREDQPFFKWWGHFHRSMLGCFTHLFVQTPEAKKLLGTIGISDNVLVSGDTRFDRVAAIASQFQPMPVVEAFLGNSPSIVAGSTWEEDEEELDHFANTRPEIKFIIAPHEIDEEHLRDIEKLFHHTVRYSQLSMGPSNVKRETSTTASPAVNRQLSTVSQQPNVLIIDNIGLLARLYHYATITYIGGGFGEDGVHNVLEAAVYARPVVMGPEYEKYIEAEDLVDCGGAFPIENALELENMLQLLLNNQEEYKKACEAAGNYVHTHTGATEKIIGYIQENRLLTN